MGQQQDDLRRLVDRDDVVLRRDHPELGGGLDRLLRAGELVAVLPGAYARAGLVQRLDVRLAALARRDPDAVVLGRAATRLTFWPALAVHEVECAVPRGCTARPGFRFRGRVVPPELVTEVDGVRVSVPALTAVDLCAELGGDVVDRALRTRTATLPGLWEALRLTSRRRGNADRRALLLDSRDEPWSEAERLCHRLLREAGLEGWKANRPVTAGGRLFSLDVVFRRARLVVEIDGRLHELDPDVFENDRHRQSRRPEGGPFTLSTAPRGATRPGKSASRGGGGRGPSTSRDQGPSLTG